MAFSMIPLSFALQHKNQLAGFTALQAFSSLSPLTIQSLRGGAAEAAAAKIVANSAPTSSLKVKAFQTSLLVATFLCTTVFGMMLFTATVLMPGISKLPDGDYLRAFQLVDGVIQKNHPVFMFTWVGSVLSLMVTTVLGLHSALDGSWKKKALLVLSTIAFLAGQVTTFTINIPRNNRVQALNVSTLDGVAKASERLHFEGPWLRANWFRTVVLVCRLSAYWYSCLSPRQRSNKD